MQALLRKEEGVGGPGMLSAAQRALSDLKPEPGTALLQCILPSVPVLISVPERSSHSRSQPSGSFAVLDARNLLP